MFDPSTSSDARDLPPYRCTLRYLLRGLLDWLAERQAAGDSAEAVLRDRASWAKAAASLAGIVVTFALLILAAPLVAAAFGKAGPAAVAQTTQALLAGALGFVFYRLGKRTVAGFHRLQALCRRGYELEMGLREPAGRHGE